MKSHFPAICAILDVIEKEVCKTISDGCMMKILEYPVRTNKQTNKKMLNYYKLYMTFSDNLSENPIWQNSSVDTQNVLIDL